MIETKYNKVTVFLLPAIYEELEVNLKQLEKYGYIESYIGDITHTPLEGIKEKALSTPSVFMLFKPSSQVLLQELIEKCEGQIIDEYDYPMGYTVIVLQYPKKHTHNFNMFIEGKYSKFTKEYQKLFPQLPSIDEKVKYGLKKPLTMLIFTKAIEWREALEGRIGYCLSPSDELYGIYTEKEILDFSIFNLEQHDEQSNKAEIS